MKIDWEKSKEHPSYGLLSFNRVHGSARNLFGSSIQHGDTIIMQLHAAAVNRVLNRDWFYTKKRLFEVEMSMSQFVELITSLNVGTGVPVTIRCTEKMGKVPDPDYESKRDEHLREFKEHLDGTYSEAHQLIEEVRSLFNEKKSLTKKDKEQILSHLLRIEQNIGTNADFQLSQFNEQMDKTVTEAKGEIEAFYQHRIMSGKGFEELDTNINETALLGETDE